jgi:hypothetical protein
VFCALADDMGLLNYFGRSSNHYCQATTRLTLSAVGGFDAHRKHHTLTRKESVATLCESQRILHNYGKYVSVNTCKLSNNNKLVEYRGIGGAWLTLLTPELLIGIAKHLSGALIAATHLKHERLSLVVARYFAAQELIPTSSAASNTYPVCDLDGRHPRSSPQEPSIKMRCTKDTVHGLVLSFRKEHLGHSTVGSFLPLHQIAVSPRRWLTAGRTPEERVVWAKSLLDFLTSSHFVSILRALVHSRHQEMRDLHVVYNYVKNIVHTTSIISDLQSIVAGNT